MTTFTFDLGGLLFGIGIVLLMIGVVPFTPVGVGCLLILSQFHLTWTWS